MDWIGYRGYDAQVSQFFICCPICGSSKIIGRIEIGGKDTLTCKNCDSIWHLNFSFLKGFNWAELEVVGKNEKGSELLGKRFVGNEIRKLAEEARKKASRFEIKNDDMEIQKKKPMDSGLERIYPNNKTIIIKEKHIVKIRCPYCNGLYDEFENRCSHCNGSR
jgi:hypothetical protein